MPHLTSFPNQRLGYHFFCSLHVSTSSSENIQKILRSHYYLPTVIISQLNNCSPNCLSLIYFVTTRINPDYPMLKIIKWCSVCCPQDKVQTHGHLRPSMILILLTSSTLSFDIFACFLPLDILWTLSNTPTFSFKSQHVGHVTFSGTLYMGISLCDYMNSELFPYIALTTWFPHLGVFSWLSFVSHFGSRAIPVSTFLIFFFLTLYSTKFTGTIICCFGLKMLLVFQSRYASAKGVGQIPRFCFLLDKF